MSVAVSGKNCSLMTAAQSLANNDQKAITETTEQLINEPLDHRGEVVLVGAGPGDAGLLTLKRTATNSAGRCGGLRPSGF